MGPRFTGTVHDSNCFQVHAIANANSQSLETGPSVSLCAMRGRARGRGLFTIICMVINR